MKVFAITQGDPAGIGPEIVLRSLDDADGLGFAPLVVAERCVLESVRELAPSVLPRVRFFDQTPTREEVLQCDGIAAVDPVGVARSIAWGQPTREDAHGTLACLDTAVDLSLAGVADAVVTAPLNKAAIATHLDPEFRGHTDYLAARSRGGEAPRYGRDYLMAFYCDGLKVALLSAHVPLRAALDLVQPDAVVEALECLAPFARGPIALAGFNPHAGEGGLLGEEDDALLVPAVATARARGLDVHGPESADSLFFRARQGEFDWVLALYHDQGLIAVKTLAFGDAANVTLGLPFLRTSVDHGTAYDIAGRGRAEVLPLRVVYEKTLDLLG
ncbi:MAG: 4-hydroxythreonine-4-phosphate dehydrogenase PdxA [Acidobacteriota bacterium]